MATYVVTDPRSGIELELTGDSPPTEQELEDIFASQTGRSVRDILSGLDTRSEDTGFLDMVKRGVVRGTKQTGSLLGDVLPAMAASAVGADDYARRQMGEAEDTQKDIEQNYGARYKSLSDVKSIGDYIPFAAETIAEQVPNLATALIPGVGAGAIGTRMAATQVAEAVGKRALAKGLTEAAAAKLAARALPAATAAGAKTGQAVGTYLGSYALNTPEVFQNIYDETGTFEPGAAALAGSVSAALDSMLPASVLARFTPGMKAGVVEKLLDRSGMKKGLSRAAIASTVEGATTEGVTETAQEAISIAAEKFVQENAPAWDSDDFNRLVESGVRGAVGGGGISGISGTASAIGEQRRERDEREQKEFDKEAAKKQAELKALYPGGQQLELLPEDPDFIEATDKFAPEKPVLGREAGAKKLQQEYLARIADPKARAAMQERFDVENRKMAKEDAEIGKAQDEAIAEDKAPPVSMEDQKARYDTRTKTEVEEANAAIELANKDQRRGKDGRITPTLAVPRQTSLFDAEGDTTKLARPALWADSKVTIMTPEVIKSLGIGGKQGKSGIHKKIAGRNLNNPTHAAAVKIALVEYMNENPTDVALKNIPEFLNRPEFTADQRETAAIENMIAEDDAPADVPPAATPTPAVTPVTTATPAAEPTPAPAVDENGQMQLGLVQAEPVTEGDKAKLATTEFEQKYRQLITPDTQEVPAAPSILTETVLGKEGFNIPRSSDTWKRVVGKDLNDPAVREDLLKYANSEVVKAGNNDSSVLVKRALNIQRMGTNVNQMEMDLRRPEKPKDDTSEETEFDNQGLSQSEEQDALQEQLNNDAARNASFDSVETTPQAAPVEEAVVPEAAPVVSDIQKWSDNLDVLEAALGNNDAATPTPVTPATTERVNVNGVSRSRVNSEGNPIAATDEELISFWRWFGDSKVVDADGNPMVVYRGVDKDGGVRAVKTGAFGAGIYVSPFADAGDPMGRASFYVAREGDNIVAGYVSLKNPLIIRADHGNALTEGTAKNDPMINALVNLGMDRGAAYRLAEQTYNREKGQGFGRQVMTRAKGQGYDGIMQYDPESGELNEIVAFTVPQVKPVSSKATRIEPEGVGRANDTPSKPASRSASEITPVSLTSNKLDDEFITLYHGTHNDIVPIVKKSGLIGRTDDPRGATFLSPRPDVALGYASMRGGETAFVKGSKPTHVPDTDRSLLVFRIPKSWYTEHLSRENLEGTAPEISFNADIPKEFLVDSIAGRKEALGKYKVAGVWEKTIETSKDNKKKPTPDKTTPVKATSKATESRLNLIKETFEKAAGKKAADKEAVAPTPAKKTPKQTEEDDFFAKVKRMRLEGKKRQAAQAAVPVEKEETASDKEELIKNLGVRNLDVDGVDVDAAGATEAVRNIVGEQDTYNAPKYKGVDLDATGKGIVQKGDLRGTLNHLISITKNPIVKQVLERIRALNLKTKIVMGEVSEYDPNTDTITIGPDGINEHVLTHELLHAAISHVLRDPTLKVTKELTKLFQQINNQLGTAYGASDIQEFAAELGSNAEFQAILKTIKAPRSGSLWSKIVQVIAEFFGFRKGQTALDAGLKFINDALDISGDIEPSLGDILYVGVGGNKTLNKFSQIISNNMPSLFGTIVTKTENSISNMVPAVRRLALGLLRLDNLNTIYGKVLPSILKLLDAIELRSGSRAQAMQAFKTALNEMVATSEKLGNKKFVGVMGAMAIDAHIAKIDLLDPNFKPTPSQDNEYLRLMGVYRSLPGDMQGVYKDIIQGYKDKLMQFRDVLMANSVGDPVAQADIKKKFDDLMAGNPSYVPSLRHGKYKVEFIDPDTDERASVSFESVKERADFIGFLEAEEKRKGKKFDIQEYTDLIDESKLGRVIAKGTLGKIVAGMQKSGATPAQIKAVREAYFEAFPAHSIMQRFRKSQNVAGMETNIIDGYKEMMPIWINKINNSKYMPQIDAALKGIESEAKAARGNRDPRIRAMAEVLADVSNHINKQSNFFQNPTFSTFAKAGTQLSYAQYIAGNISSALINVLTIPMLLTPILGGRFGLISTNKAIASAMKEAVNWYGKDNKYTGNARYTNLYKLLLDHDQLGGVALDALKDAGSNPAQKLLSFTGIPFGATEKYNRAVAAIAAYELALAGDSTKGIAPMSPTEAARYALTTVKDINTSGLIDTAPALMQNSLGRTFYTFKSYTWNTTFILARAWHQAFKGKSKAERAEAAKQLLGVYAMAAMFGGAKGLPFMGAASVLAYMMQAMANAFGDDDDEPYDFNAMLREFVGELAYKGPVNYFTNLEVASRTGIANDLVFRDDPQGVEEHGYVMEAFSQIFGPALSTVVNAEKGLKMVTEGNLERGIELMAPSVLRNFMKGFRYMGEGALTLKGEPLVEDVSAWNNLMQMAGFSPADLTLGYETTGMRKKVEGYTLGRRKAILDAISIATTAGDSEMLADAFDRMQKFNMAYPEKRINGNAISRSRRARVAARENQINGVAFDPKLKRRLENMFPDDEE